MFIWVAPGKRRCPGAAGLRPATAVYEVTEMILQDTTGWYDLRAVTAVTPYVVRQFVTGEGKTHPSPPPIKTVAVLHMFGGAFTTDTAYADVLREMGEPTTGTVQPATGGQ